jgi:spermidine/putrescine-binding protein
MKRSNVWKMLVMVIVASLVLSACGAAKGTAATPTTAASGDIVLSNGYVCPKAEPKMEVTSKELNLFVWTEYIPADMQKCFELVYGIKVNRDEYSSNEEMYAKISATLSSRPTILSASWSARVCCRNWIMPNCPTLSTMTRTT